MGPTSLLSVIVLVAKQRNGQRQSKTFDQSNAIDCSDIVGDVKLAIAEFIMAVRGFIYPSRALHFQMI